MSVARVTPGSVAGPRGVRLLDRHGWWLAGLAAGVALAARLHVKPWWASTDVTTSFSSVIDTLVFGGLALVVVSYGIVWAIAARSRHAAEAVLVFLITYILMASVLDAADPVPAIGTATITGGIPGQAASWTGPIECVGRGGVEEIMASGIAVDTIYTHLPLDSPGAVGSIRFVPARAEWGAGATGVANVAYPYPQGIVVEADAVGWVRGHLTGPALEGNLSALDMSWDCGRAPTVPTATTALWAVTDSLLVSTLLIALAGWGIARWVMAQAARGTPHAPTDT